MYSSNLLVKIISKRENMVEFLLIGTILFYPFLLWPFCMARFMIAGRSCNGDRVEMPHADDICTWPIVYAAVPRDIL